MSVERRERIRVLNDQLRRQHIGGRIFLSHDLSARGAETVRRALVLIREFTAFSEGNDPHGEHDFGSVELDGDQLFWKIDYYSPDLTAHAEDPADPIKCHRVMTIMYAWEY